MPRAEASEWQTHVPSESALLRSARGSGMGVWVDPSLPEADQLVMVAEQVQQFVVEDLPSHHLPANWPQCPEHPDNHPASAVVHDGRAVWACPTSKRLVAPVGELGG